MITTTKEASLSQAKAYARQEYAKQDTTVEAYRRKCHDYVLLLKHDFNISPKLQESLKHTIDTTTPLEAWKALNMVWIDNTPFILGEGSKNLFREELQKANGYQDKALIQRHMIDVVLDSPLYEKAGIDWSRVKDRKMLEAKPHFEALVKEAKTHGQELFKEDYWFINKVLLDYCYAEAGIENRREEPGLRKGDAPQEKASETSPFGMPPPPIGMI